MIDNISAMSSAVYRLRKDGTLLLWLPRYRSPYISPERIDLITEAGAEIMVDRSEVELLRPQDMTIPVPPTIAQEYETVVEYPLYRDAEGATHKQRLGTQLLMKRGLTERPVIPGIVYLTDNRNAERPVFRSWVKLVWEDGQKEKHKLIRAFRRKLYKLVGW